MQITRKPYAMKKVCSALLLMLAVLASCQRLTGGQSEAAEVTFDSIVVDTDTRLKPSQDMPSGELSLHIAYAKPLNDDTLSAAAAWRINKTLLSSDLLMSDFATGLQPDATKGLSPKSYMGKALSLMAANYRKMYLADYAELFKVDPSTEPTYNRAYTVRTQVKQGNDSIINYIADSYYYDGGAHGQSVTWARNFNKHTGRVITLASILRPGYEGPLTLRISAELTRMFKVRSLQELQDSVGVFMDMDVYIPKNYIIDSKGITFIYYQDEVAPHAVGELRLTLTYEQLASLNLLRKK